MTEPYEIGASDVAAILGLSKWQTPDQAWARLRGMSSSEGSWSTARGHLLELGILQDAAELHGLRLYPWATSRRHLRRTKAPWRAGIYRGPAYEEGRITHPEHPWQGCRPDAIILHADGSRELIEVKTTRSWSDWEAEDGSQIVPPYYVVQCQWQMHVMGVQTTYLEAFCVLSDERRSYRIERSPAMAERIVSHLTDWRARYLLGDERPPNLTAQVAGLIWPRERTPESWAPASEFALDLCGAYRDADAAEKAAKAAKDEARDRLCELIQDHAGIDGLCTWRADKRGRRTFRLKGDEK